MGKIDKRNRPFDCIIDIKYIPFPSEEKRREAYYTHAELFLKAKERQLKRQSMQREQNVHGL
jgi:hypothetical protein